MNNSDTIAKVVVKVYLVSGREITHTYDMPKSKKGKEEIINSIVNNGAILVGERKGYLNFENPIILYNRDNIEGIEVFGLGAEELGELLRKAQSKAGFIK